MKREKLSSAAASGVVALIFLVLGFQAALFMGNVFKERRAEKPAFEAVGAEEGTDGRDDPGSDSKEDNRVVSAVKSAISPAALEKPSSYTDSRTVISERIESGKEHELFEFDPNLVTQEELQKLGFSERQATVILNYREKGGSFRKKSDFAKMYVVDSLKYAQLEPYIVITKIDINSADSLTLLSLTGIGPYYAHKILEYRERLGGYFTSTDQLLEIEGIDEERMSGFSENIEARSVPFRFDIWSAEQWQLERHPYIGSYAAKGIIRYKSLSDSSLWTVENLISAGILKRSAAEKLGLLLPEIDL
ncbi:MAG: helix-hairpin-helix domain-containing protein [Bacteroidales bacterium]|nr:helix-hairpin-helix domain-containing protein [Bacteroidales bacterium]